MSAARIVHVAGDAITWDGRYLRQRCSWCGAVLIDMDLTLVGVAIPEGKTEEQARADGDLNPGSWAFGALVAVEGIRTYVVDPEPSTSATDGAMTAPKDSCMLIDPAVTA